MVRGEDRGECHPSAAELESFLLGEMSPRQAAPVVTHLLRRCDTCRQQMTPLASVLFTAGQEIPELALGAGTEYDFPLFRAFASARRLAASDGGKPPESVRSAAPILREVPSPKTTPRPLSHSLRERCESALEQCRTFRYRDPDRMILAATYAVQIAERSDASEVASEELADLQARSWSELGNARRIVDDLEAAEAALSRALERSGRGTGDPLLLAQIMDVTASLYIDQRRFEEAQSLLDRASAIYRHQGDAQAAGRMLVSQGMAAGYAFDSERAVRLLAQALREIDAARHPRLAFAAIHNLLWCLVDCGLVTDAHRFLEWARPLYRHSRERFDDLKARWLEGRIALGRGDRSGAERFFLEVRRGFEDAELIYDAALISMDLAALWLSQGRTAEIYRLVEDLIAVFRSRNIRREALGALLMLKEALRKDRATADMLRTVTAELWRLERFPSIKGHAGGL